MLLWRVIDWFKSPGTSDSVARTVVYHCILCLSKSIVNWDNGCLLTKVRATAMSGNVSVWNIMSSNPSPLVLFLFERAPITEREDNAMHPSNLTSLKENITNPPCWSAAALAFAIMPADPTSSSSAKIALALGLGVCLGTPGNSFRYSACRRRSDAETKVTMRGTENAVFHLWVQGAALLG